VTCLSITEDEEYLFSGGKDGIVVVWYVPTRVPLCKLEVEDFEIDELLISHDHTILVALNNDGNINYWEIQSNS